MLRRVLVAGCFFLLGKGGFGTCSFSWSMMGVATLTGGGGARSTVLLLGSRFRGSYGRAAGFQFGGVQRDGRDGYNAVLRPWP